AQAKVLEVRAGSVAEEIDITLGKTRKTYEAAGRVLDEEGRPLAGIYVQLGSLPTDGKELIGNMSGVGPTDERGEFRAKGLMPGRWGAWGTDGDPDAGKQGNSYGDMAAFEVVDRNIGGLELRMSRGAKLSGVVQIEGTSDPAVLARRPELKLWVQVNAPPGTSSPPSYALGDIRPDGTFEVTGMRPGKVNFQLAWPRPKGFSLLSVKRDGVELPGGLEVRKGEHVRNVVVAYAYGTSVVRGQVQVNGGPRPTGARLFAQTRRPGGTAAIGWGEVDALGRFVIENLSAGEYELVLMDFSASDVPFEKRQPLARQTISVPESGELKVTLAYDVSVAPKEDEP
nr:hypothetical protein [Acidobacteriota bacterium]